MKIGLMISNIGASKNALGFCKQIGLDGVQLGISYGKYHVDKVTDKRYAKLEKALNANNLEISAYCGELGGHGLMDESENPQKLALIKRMVDFAVDKGVSIISTHIGVIPEDKNCKLYSIMQKAATEAGQYAKERGVIIAIETGPEMAKTLKEFIDGCKGGIGVNLDPANLTMCARQDAVEAVYILKDYIVHTHAKDGINLQPVDTRFVYGFINEKDKEGLTEPTGDIYKETRLGEGGVDWDNYIKALKDIGYDGYLTIEREFGKNTMQDVKDGAEFLKSKVYKKDLITIGIIGCGGIASGAHIPPLNRNNRVRVKYTCDALLDRAESAKNKVGADKAVTDYKEILKDSEVDGVLICTHTDFHKIAAIDALKAGKSVLAEKPVALNYVDACKMAEAEKQSGKILNIAVCMRYNTAVNRLKSIIRGGVIGKPYHVVCNFRSFRRIPGIGGAFTQKDKSGGGVLMDLGIHYLDLILYILGEPEVLTVSGDCYGKIGTDIKNYKNGKLAVKNGVDGIFDVDDYAGGHIRLGNDVSISFNGAWAQNIDSNEEYIDFLGDKGGIRYYYCKGFVTLIDKPDRIIEKKAVLDQADMYNLEMLDFASAIRSGTNKSSRNSIERILPSAKLLEDIYKSSEAKCEIKCKKE